MNCIQSKLYRRDVTWLEDWHELFRSCDILPDMYQDIPEQFNCISRIIIVSILLLFLFYGFNAYVLTLLIILLALITCYIALYKKKTWKQTMIENYKPPNRTPIYQNTCSGVYQDPIIMYDSKTPDQEICISGNNPSLIDVQQAHTWCQPDLPLGNETASVNQNLAGDANPKTRAIPVIPPPLADVDTWNPNDFIVPSWINDQKRQELWQNGYMTWDSNRQPCSASVQKDLFGKYGCVSSPPSIRENFYQSAQYGLPSQDNQMMDTSFGYYPDNAKYNYPVNRPPIPCNPALSEYNKNLYSIPLQPNVYTRSQVNQPDASMSNLGISFTQPHLPSVCHMDDRGNMITDEYDPNQYPSEYLLQGRNQYSKDTIGRHEIYDPRLTGYGTSYRSYNDPITGSTKFYYDDIDAHTRYNFISRNKIDFTNFAPTSGPYQGLPPNDFRQMADTTFHNDIMQQRTELGQRLMAKNSHREWQRRSAPIQTNGFSRAGCGTSSSLSYAGPRGNY